MRVELAFGGFWSRETYNYWSKTNGLESISQSWDSLPAAGSLRNHNSVPGVSCRYYNHNGPYLRVCVAKGLSEQGEPNKPGCCYEDIDAILLS